MAKRHHTQHSALAGIVDNAPSDAVALEFARQLQALLNKKGWTQSDLAREATLHMEKGQVSRDSVSKYINARCSPSKLKLSAIAKALGVDVDVLWPVTGVTRTSEKRAAVNVRDLGDGMAWLGINGPVPWPAAVKILDMVKGDGKE